MNIRILIEKGKVTEPANGLIWYKDAITWGKARIQVLVHPGEWIDVPVVECSETVDYLEKNKENKYCTCLLPERVVTSPIDTVDSCKYCCKIIKED